jgi:3-oxoacyl-[acyl-carrier protein] reductase
MKLGLENKIVIITGANGGIGSSIAQAFLEENSRVILFYRGKLEKLKPLLEWAKENQHEHKVFPFEVDLSNSENIKKVVNEVIEKFERIDVLVNNAGSTVEKPFLSISDEEWNEIVGINLTSIFKLSKEVVKHMLGQKKGAVVNISSVVGERFGRGVSAYAACKAGVNRITECLAQEMGKKGIRVNSVCPGIIETKMSQAMTFTLSKYLDDLIPMKRLGRPDEVAKAVLFLASDEAASYINGHNLFVDGGISL